jgi:tRNA(fMet)-specific endonuclease VapC
VTAYLLDTNAVIAVINEPSGKVAKRLRRQAPSDVFVSSVVMHELFFGAFNSARTDANVALVDALAFNVVSFDLDDARASGQVRAALKAEGLPIGPYDVLIAGQALSRGLTLVTHNTREFARVPQLLLVDWMTGR